MSFESMNRIEGAEKEKRKISDELIEAMPDIAKSIIKDLPENQKFKNDPDDPREHERKYHQYGIITHTKELVDFYRQESGKAFEKWGIKEKVDKKLSEEIDGKAKSELLEIGMALHDVGKFDRGFRLNVKSQKMDYPDYREHESKSEELIRTNSRIQDLLRNELNLTDSQIDYIAKTAGLHYKLGNIRTSVKEKKGQYNLAYTKSNECDESCKKIAGEFPEYKEEIGIMFFCDNMAKSDFIMGADNDKEIEKLTKDIKKDLNDRKIRPEIAGTVKQIPVNLAVAERYMKMINE